MLQLGAPAAEARAEKFIVGRAQVAGRTRESEDLLSVRHGSSSFGRDAANASMRREKCRTHATRKLRVNIRVTNRAKNSGARLRRDRKSTRLNSSHSQISYAVFCLKK